jgi:hypothetical protein
MQVKVLPMFFKAWSSRRLMSVSGLAESTSSMFHELHLCCDILCLCAVLNGLLFILESLILFSIFHSGVRVVKVDDVSKSVSL